MEKNLNSIQQYHYGKYNIHVLVLQCTKSVSQLPGLSTNSHSSTFTRSSPRVAFFLFSLSHSLSLPLSQSMQSHIIIPRQPDVIFNLFIHIYMRSDVGTQRRSETVLSLPPSCRLYDFFFAWNFRVCVRRASRKVIINASVCESHTVPVVRREKGWNTLRLKY